MDIETDEFSGGGGILPTCLRLVWKGLKQDREKQGEGASNGGSEEKNTCRKGETTREQEALRTFPEAFLQASHLICHSDGHAGRRSSKSTRLEDVVIENYVH